MDRENVIKGLIELKKYLPSTMWEPINNAVALMKEQDQDRVSVPEMEGDRWGWFYVCSECHGLIDWKDQVCPHCKARIDWNG